MPKRNDIQSILVIGSGPIVIGQACEFDYSGTQACSVLKSEGFKVILVNSNPATIMTDPALADRTYIEPLNLEVLKAVIEKERPDAILPTLGGQTALNLAMQAHSAGILDEFGVQLIGASAKSIETAENRERFKEAMVEIGLEVAPSAIAHSLEVALSHGDSIGYPVIVRPSYILGGAGTGIAKDRDELEILAREGLETSPATEILIEKSIAGWKEYELEVMRDRADNCVVICSIENLDPMGIHTGDSITVAPAQTLTDFEYQKMRDAAFACIRRVGVETGGSNIQFAINPDDGRMIVIEMNPRVSRSSALASKATGFPIAKIAAKLAVGYCLDEIQNDITKVTPASFEPTIDYVVTKIPRWAFEKLPGSKGLLGTRMQSVGEVMAIGRTFPESLQKAIRSLEEGRNGLNGDPKELELDGLGNGELLELCGENKPGRIFAVEAAIRRGISLEEIFANTFIDPWFLQRIEEITCERKWWEERAKSGKNAVEEVTKKDFVTAKKMGFSDSQLAYFLNIPETILKAKREDLGVFPVYKTVDTCAGEFKADTPYYYATFEDESEVARSSKQKVIILGSGPNRIGQGIEFDYCCVHAAKAVKEAGFEAIMVNCNPETVSTDYDTSDRLYFEPLTPEDLGHILRAESLSCTGEGKIYGVIVSLGGQTPLKLANSIDPELVLGTSPRSIDLAEDREQWNKLCQVLEIPQAPGGTATNIEKAIEIAGEIGYPVLIRPSYVLGGRAMEIVFSDDDLERAWSEINSSGSLQREGSLAYDRPVLIDRFLEDAVEVDVDALRDNQGESIIGGVMEHVEQAGVHSGDSACAIPVQTLSREVVALIQERVVAIADALEVVGPINVQFAVKDGEAYVLEANPRASRTMPFVSKAIGCSLAKVAARLMTGSTFGELVEEGLLPKDIAIGPGGVPDLAEGLDYVSVKEAVLPFSRFPEVDSLLGPEMRSTGEVMGIDSTFGLAFAKSQSGAGSPLPDTGMIFLSLADRDKKAGIVAATKLVGMGFKLAATSGTANACMEAKLPIEIVVKKRTVPENSLDSLESDNLTDAISLISTGKISLIVNTPRGRGAMADGAYIRHAASLHGVPCLTTVSAALAACDGINSWREHGLSVRALQDIHAQGIS